MKTLKILSICFCIILILSCNVYALGDVFNTGDSWLNTGINEADKGTTMNTKTMKKALDQLYNILLAVGTGVAVIVGAILGIQFMAAGIDKRVQVKESLFPYMISCVVVFGALGIWKLVVMILGDI